MGKVYTKPGGGSSDLSFVTAAAGDIVSGKVGANADGEPVNGSLSLSGNAAASDVASGKTFYTTNPKSKQTGTLVDRGQYQMAGGWGSGGSGSDAYFAMNAIPEGIYRSNGASWAPEVRMKQSDVRAAIGATNAANWRSNTTIAGLKGSMPEQGGKTVTPTASTQTVVSAGRYVTGDIKVAGVSGLPDVRPNKTIERKNTEIKEITVPFMTAGHVADIVGTDYSAVLFRVKIKLNTSNAYKDLGLVYFDKFKIDNDFKIILEFDFKDNEITPSGATTGYLTLYVTGVPNTTGVRFWSFLYIDKSYQEFNATSYDLQITLEGAWK